MNKDELEFAKNVDLLRLVVAHLALDLCLWDAVRWGQGRSYQNALHELHEAAGRLVGVETPPQKFPVDRERVL